MDWVYEQAYKRRESATPVVPEQTERMLRERRTNAPQGAIRDLEAGMQSVGIGENGANGTYADAQHIANGLAAPALYGNRKP